MARDITPIVAERLAALGWTVINSTALAAKTYDTINAPTEARVYLTSGDEHNRSLLGEYYSEGRNILEPRGQLLPHTATDAEVARLTDAWVASAEQAIDQSYARRLLLTTR